MSPGGVRVGVMDEALSGGVHFKGNLRGLVIIWMCKTGEFIF